MRKSIVLTTAWMIALAFPLVARAQTDDPWGPLDDLIGKDWLVAPVKETEYSTSSVVRYSWEVPGKVLRRETAGKDRAELLQLDPETGIIRETVDGKPTTMRLHIENGTFVTEFTGGDYIVRHRLEIGPGGMPRSFATAKEISDPAFPEFRLNQVYTPGADFAAAAGVKAAADRANASGAKPCRS